jgi:hypothetical protein
VLRDPAEPETRHEERLVETLVCETVLPDVGCSGFDSLTDISRITFSSMQRSEKQWTALLASVGLRIVKIWAAKGGPFPVIEAEIGED